MSYLAVNDMAPDDRTGAQALVRTVAPTLPAARWSELVERGPPGGALVLRGPDGSVFGFASYRPAQDENGRTILLVDTFVTAELSSRGTGRALLAAALEARAKEMGCAAVRLADEADGRLRHGLCVAALH